MTAPDDLHVGNWIAVTGRRDQQEQATTYFAAPASPPPVPFTGEPAKIIAISWPFLCVWSPKEQMADSIDIRFFSVQRLHRTYVRKMLELPTPEYPARHGASTPVYAFSEEHEEHAEPGERRCPLCSGPLSERMVAGDARGWHLHCKNCGFSGSTP